VIPSIANDANTIPSIANDGNTWSAPLETDRVLLRPIDPSMYEDLYRIAVDPGVMFRWRNRGIPPPPEEFLQSIRSDALAQFAVLGKSTLEVCGQVLAYGADFRHSRCSIAAALDSEAVGKGLGIEASVLFVDFVFKTWPFHKVLFEIPEFNIEQFRTIADRYLQLETVMPNQQYLAGHYHDVRVCSISRKNWPPRRMGRRSQPVGDQS